MASSGKASQLLRKNSAWVSPRLDRGTETPPALCSPGFLFPPKSIGHIIARQIFQLLLFHLSSSLSLSFFLPRMFLLYTLFSFTSFIRTRTLPFSHWFHLHTHNFFFLAPFVFKKTFSGPFLFLLRNPEVRFSHSDSRYRSANERRAFFIYTCCSALRSVSCSDHSHPRNLRFPSLSPLSLPFFRTTASRLSLSLL